MKIKRRRNAKNKKNESAKTKKPKKQKFSWDRLYLVDGDWAPLKQVFIKEYGVNAAVYLIHCMEVQIILGKQRKLINGCWFYWTKDNVKRVLGFSDDQFRQSKSLLSKGICGQRNKKKIRETKYVVLKTKEMKGKECIRIRWKMVKKLLNEVTPDPLLVRYRKIKYAAIR
jgi:hypothetical protein